MTDPFGIVDVVQFSATSDVTADEVSKYQSIIGAVSGDIGVEIRLSGEVMTNGRRAILASAVMPWDEDDSRPILVIFTEDVASMFPADTFNWTGGRDSE